MSEAMSLLPLFLFLLLLSGDNGIQCFQEKKAFNLQKFQWREQGHLSTCQPQISRTEKAASVLEMKHKDYCSGLIKDWDKELQKHLIADDIRVRSLQLQIKKALSGEIEDLSETQIPVTSGIKIQTLNYIVTVELGGKNMTVIVDTGSDLTWVQCEPCNSCYNQQDPLFKPMASPSYQPVLCNSSTCQSLEFATGNSGVCGTSQPTCNYYVSYGDGSYTRGELGREHLNLGTTAVQNFLFGCGRNNKGLFGGAAGLMGLGRSELSLVSQTYSQFGGVFSYCLPSLEDDASGSLILGEDSSVYKNSTPISYTKMVPNPQLSTFYLLNLTDISIGGVALQAPGFAKAGILIDSGTVITRLPPSVYRALKAEFLKQFSGFPSAPGFSILDTCFNLTGYQEVNIPTVKMHYEGDIKINVDVHGIFYFVKTDTSQVCLALASLSYEDEIGIIGNYQQTNLRVVYDTKESRIGFAEETCSFI
ncbi:aspartyl protease family protein At5g10770 isoform X2 [Telopea speciosissima]|uniref:aspartyl protease family protein At5g10770 isoform X2 n=1 Tax=Telopea speciosissima TaxID=54955 RepID=UPI001CC44D51|nr:aspartyl protease family protein At5g10770 isoform X2 [Telopea speciosissima]